MVAKVAGHAGLDGLGLAVLGVAGTLWIDRLLRQAGRADLTALTASAVPLAVAALSAVTVGAVLAARRPRHPVGWLLLAMGLSIAVHDLTYSWTRYGLVVRPGALPGAAYLAGLNNGLVVQWIACAGFVLLLTPTGLPSPRWRWWARIVAGAALLWLLGRSSTRCAPSTPRSPTRWGSRPCTGRRGCSFAALVVLVSLIVGAVSLLLRFRRARGVERLQLRWLIWGAVVASLALLVAIAACCSTTTSPC